VANPGCSCSSLLAADASCLFFRCLFVLTPPHLGFPKPSTLNPQPSTLNAFMVLAGCARKTSGELATPLASWLSCWPTSNCSCLANSKRLCCKRLSHLWLSLTKGHSSKANSQGLWRKRLFCPLLIRIAAQGLGAMLLLTHAGVHGCIAGKEDGEERSIPRRGRRCRRGGGQRDGVGGFWRGICGRYWRELAAASCWWRTGRCSERKCVRARE
jgi:hypothetical protein